MTSLIQILPYLEIGLAVLLVFLILIQRSEAGLGSAFGDSGVGGKITRRGIEKTIFNATIITTILFILSIALDFIY